ncbi:MAG: hypothetical protein ACPG4T_16215 [Nannocystaceae bacterium]
MQRDIDVFAWLKIRLLGALTLAIPAGCSDESTGVTTADVTTATASTTDTDTEESTVTSDASTSGEPETTGPDPCDTNLGMCDRCLDYSGYPCGGFLEEFFWYTTDNIGSCATCDTACQQEAEEDYLESFTINDGCPPCTPYFSLTCHPSIPDEHGRCTYIFDVGLSCIGGRPLRAGTTPLLATLANGPDAASWQRATALTQIDGVSLEIRARIVEHWTQVARAEHASVGSFARVVLSLLQLGAPLPLIQETQVAMSDETRHARLAFGMASAISGRTIGPGRLELTPEVGGAQELNELALSTFLDGCLAETVAAMEARYTAAFTADSATRGLLEQIAEDEAEHAALAWRTLRWLIQVAGAHVERRFLLQLAHTITSQAMSRACDDSLLAHGCLEPGRRQYNLRRRCIQEVLVPCIARLFDGHAAVARTMA